VKHHVRDTLALLLVAVTAHSCQVQHDRV
jgi:hypothetical protein